MRNITILGLIMLSAAVTACGMIRHHHHSHSRSHSHAGNGYRDSLKTVYLASKDRDGDGYRDGSGAAEDGPYIEQETERQETIREIQNGQAYMDSCKAALHPELII